MQLAFMRIVYIHQYFDTPASNGGTRSYEFARRLVAAGHEVHMVTSDRGSHARRGAYQTTEAGIEVHWLPVSYSNHMNYMQRSVAFFRFALGAAAKAGSLACDVVFATSTPLTVAIPGVWAARYQRVPMVFEVRDLWPKVPIALGALQNPALRWAATALEKWAYVNSEAVVALSPGMCAGVVEGGVAPERVAMIPNACDLAEFQVEPERVQAFRASRPWLGEGPVVLYAGAFGRVNGVGWLVPVARHLQDIAPDVRVLLIGDGAERAEVEAKAVEAGVLGVNLFMERPLPKAEIPAAFATSALAANLTIDVEALQANSANKFFDSLAAGVPVLLNGGGWLAEMVERFGAGIVAWRVDERAVAEHIAGALKDSVWRASASAAARKLAEERFDRDDLAGKLESVLRAAANRRGHVAADIAPWNSLNRFSRPVVS